MTRFVALAGLECSERLQGRKGFESEGQGSRVEVLRDKSLGAKAPWYAHRSAATSNRGTCCISHTGKRSATVGYLAQHVERKCKHSTRARRVRPALKRVLGRGFDLLEPLFPL